MKQIIIIVVINLILYFKTLKFFLVADDLQWYARNKTGWMPWSQVKTPKALKYFIFERFYGCFTFRVFKNHAKNLVLDHFITIVLNTTIAVMIYKVLGNNDISFWAAILYSCNPFNNQTSIWLNGRRYAINIIIVLSIIYLSSIPHGWIPSAFLYWISSFFHYTAILAPILLVDKYPIILLIIPVVLLLGWKTTSYKIKMRLSRMIDIDRLKFTPKRLIIIVKTYGHYFFKMLFPGICSMYYQKLHFWGQTKEGNKDAYSINFEFAQGIIALFASIAIVYFVPSEYRMMAIFMCLSIFQWCNIVPIVQDLAERYVNISNVFMMFFLSFFINTLVHEQATAIIAIFCGYYAAMLMVVMNMYKSEAARWEYHRYFFPTIPNPLKFECEYLIHDQKNPARAWVLIQEYLKYGGKDFTILFQAAKCHQMVYRIEEARKYAKLASENFHLYKEKQEQQMVDEFLKGCQMIENQMVPSRQVQRDLKRNSKNK